MSVFSPSAHDGSPQVLALIDDLGDAEDSKQVIAAATRRFGQMFGDWAVYALLLSDPAMERWRLLPVCNPEGPAWGGVAVEALPDHADIDAIAERVGTDATTIVQNSPQLRLFLAHEQAAFAANHGVDAVMAEVRALLPLDVHTILAASWKRPGGGRGCVFLGYTQSFLAKDLLPLYALAVKVTIRLALYPGYVQRVAHLERISRSLRQNLVHDLKTPVAVIQGLAETLLLPGVGDDGALRRDLLEQVCEQTERMLDDLRDVLAPLDADWAPQVESFDLALLLQKAVIAERHTARAAGHTFDLVGADQPLVTRADRRKIRRVCENLLGNAVKYSPGANQRVQIALEADNTAARISFTDQGIGMTEAQIARVLRQTGRAVDPGLGIEGSGFGLDSCRQVLEAHGGTLHATSRPGEGSTFTVCFPLNPQA